MKAVVLGLMTDIGRLDALRALAFFMFYGAYLGATGGTADDLMTLARGNGIDFADGARPRARGVHVLGARRLRARGSRSIRSTSCGLVLAACSVVAGLALGGDGEPDPMAGLFSLLTVASVHDRSGTLACARQPALRVS